MIRINLLPKEDKGHRRMTVNFQAGDLVLPVAIVAAAGLIILGTVLSQNARVTSLNQSIAKLDDESRKLAPQIEKVKRLAQERAELDLRLGIISKLEKGRTQSVRLMDELARCVPDHLWMTQSQQDASDQLTLEGVTYSNLVVSDFMSRLERSPLFSDVELGVAERGAVGSKDVVKFRITCRVAPEERAN